MLLAYTLGPALIVLGGAAWWQYDGHSSAFRWWLRNFAYASIITGLLVMLGVQLILGSFLGTTLLVALYRHFFCSNSGPSVSGAARDVRDDADFMLRLAQGFDPEPLISRIDIQKNDVVFVGLNGERKPVYLPRRVLDKNHLEILGESGVGKSSLAGVLLSQFARAGEAVVVLDPKADANLPGALARAGARWGFPVYVCDLRPSAGFPQVNPFAGCRPDQVEELLQVALELGKTGDAGVDFYRGKDREATGFIAEALADGKTDMLEILARAGEDERVTEQENLWRELRQLGRVKAFHTETGLDLQAVLARPCVLYVIGSTTRLEVVAAQKLLLQRILQILDERADRSRPVALFLDELKYILSPAALRAAGTIRDRNCHLIFAHQSLGDLDDCPGLSPKAVRGAIWGNCGIKICYRMQDAGTARELETLAGETAVVAKRRSSDGEREQVTRSVERGKYMPAHVFTHLPKPSAGEASVGVVFGLGTAFYLSTRYLESGPAPAAIPAPARPPVPQAAPQAAPQPATQPATQPAKQPAPRREKADDDDLADILKQ